MIPLQLPGGKYAAIGWASIPFLFALSYWFIALSDSEVSIIGGRAYRHVKVRREKAR